MSKLISVEFSGSLDAIETFKHYISVFLITGG